MKWFIYIILIVANTALTAQQTQTATSSPTFAEEIENYLSHSVPTITVEEAKTAAAEYLFLDAREMEEYKVSHIPDARHIGYDRFNVKKLSRVAKDTPIIVYCSIGYRSEKVGELLQKAGYTDVRNLYGSIFEWANKGYPLQTIAGDTCQKVHTYNKKWSKWVTNTDYTKVW